MSSFGGWSDSAALISPPQIAAGLTGLHYDFGGFKSLAQHSESSASSQQADAPKDGGQRRSVTKKQDNEHLSGKGSCWDSKAKSYRTGSRLHCKNVWIDSEWVPPSIGFAPLSTLPFIPPVLQQN